MKALTISQPCASLIASGKKFVENRTWQTPYRGPLAIHAGKGQQYMTLGEMARDGLPTSAILAVCVLRSCLPLAYTRRVFERGQLPAIAGKDKLGLADVERILQHEHTEGPWCWILEQVRPLKNPINATGARGLWEWTPPADFRY